MKDNMKELVHNCGRYCFLEEAIGKVLKQSTHSSLIRFKDVRMRYLGDDHSALGLEFMVSYIGENRVGRCVTDRVPEEVF